MTDTGHERRKQPRLSFRDTVSFSAKDGVRSHGTSVDISLGGMFIETMATWPFGTSIQVFLVIPTRADELSLPATVRWVNDRGMGLQFESMGAKDTHALTELLSELAEQG